MNSTATELLANPQCGHIVYPYTDEAQLADAVCRFAGAGLRKGEAAVLIMTAAHRDPIRARLQDDGFNLRALEAEGLLVIESAEDLLGTFLFDGILDELRFKINIGRRIMNAKWGAVNHPNRPVRLFGEMVDLLWETHLKTTQRLEELWNDIIEAYRVPLLCAYSLGGSKPNVLPQSLLACHAHNAGLS
jgi:hypothetical protein